jgi:hypothetical protein
MMNKEQAIQLAKVYVSSKKDLNFSNYFNPSHTQLQEVYDYIFGSLILDLNKFVDDDLVEVKVAADIGVEVIKLNLEEYLNSDLFYKNN